MKKVTFLITYSDADNKIQTIGKVDYVEDSAYLIQEIFLRGFDVGEYWIQGEWVIRIEILNAAPEEQ